MTEKLVIHALIPARYGSKDIRLKNIKIYNGHPLMAHSIIQAKRCKYISEVVVSTDSEEFKKIALQYGASVPFLRPYQISGDYSTDYECFEQYIDFLKFGKKRIPDIIVHLRPTYPERKTNLINSCIETFLLHYKNYDSLRTIIPLTKSLFKMYTIDNELLIPTYRQYKDIKEPHNQVRQILPPTYLHNGCVDIVKSSTLINKNSMCGTKIYPYIMNKSENNDIDTLEDWSNSIKRSNPINIPKKRNNSNYI
jgi:N-acylneuraminate cytidylyltransferase